MTPKERYEARKAAKKAGYVVRDRNERDDMMHDPEELLFDIANSLYDIAAALQSMTGKPVHVANNITVSEAS